MHIFKTASPMLSNAAFLIPDWRRTHRIRSACCLMLALTSCLSVTPDRSYSLSNLGLLWSNAHSQPRKRLDNLKKHLIMSSGPFQPHSTSHLVAVRLQSSPSVEQKRRSSSQLHDFKRTRGQIAGDVTRLYARVSGQGLKFEQHDTPTPTWCG